MEDYRKLLAKTAVAELKEQLKSAKIRGFSKMKKAEIVDLLVSKKQYSQPTSPAHEAYVASVVAEEPLTPKVIKAPKVVKEKVVKEKVVKEKIVKEKATKSVGKLVVLDGTTPA